MKKMTTVLAIIFMVSQLYAAGIQEQHPVIVEKVESSAVQEAPSVAEPVEAQLDDPSGREVANNGIEGILKGTLHAEKGEWYLNCDDVMYELHMGILGHSNPDMFIDGAEAVVTGFIYHNHIAPILVQTPQTSQRFWREDRFPVWAGGGGGRNQVEYPGERGEADPIGLGRTDL